MARGFVVMAVAAIGLAAPAQAQIFSRQDLGTVASVGYGDCPSLPAPIAADEDKAFTELGLPLATFAAQVAGDATAAAANALGAALQEAARARTFAATGQTSFEFYQVKLEGVDPRLAPAFGLGGHCLVIQVPSPTRADGTALYIEAQLEGRPDGFLVRPLVVRYDEPLDGAPDSRALPAELHLTFATPGARTADTEIGAVFAVARIPLPAMAPNRRVSGRANDSRRSGPAPIPADPETWAGYASVVMSPRPTTGTPNDFLTALTTAETQRVAQAQVVVGLDRALTAARRAPTPMTPEAQLAIDQAQLALSDGRTVLAATEARVATLAGLRGGLFGSTNVQARFVLVRNENGFLKAIGKSLQDRAATLGTGVTGALTPDAPEGPGDAWTAFDTTYVTAMNDVMAKEAALATAVAGVDPGAILTAQINLINAKAVANAAAAASGRTLPYPGIVGP